MPDGLGVRPPSYLNAVVSDECADGLTGRRDDAESAAPRALWGSALPPQCSHGGPPHA